MAPRKRKTTKAAPKRRRSRVQHKTMGEAMAINAAQEIIKHVGIAKTRAKTLDVHQITTLQRIAFLMKAAF